MSPQEYNHRRARLQMTLDLMKEASASRPRSRPAEEKPSRFAQLINKVKGVKEDRKPPVTAAKYSRRRRDEELGQDSGTEQGDEVHLIPMEERHREEDHPTRTSGASSSRTSTRDTSSKAAASGKGKTTAAAEGSPKPAVSKAPVGADPKPISRPLPSKSFTASSAGGARPSASVSIPRPKPAVPSSSEPKPSLSRPPTTKRGEPPRDLFSNI